MAFAGSPCKGVKLTTDEFTGAQEASIVAGASSSGHPVLVVEFTLVDGVPTAVFPFGASGLHDGDLPADTTILLKLEDGMVLEFAAPTSAPPVADAVYGVYTTWTVSVPLSEEDLNALKSSRLMVVRTTLPGAGELTWELAFNQRKKSVQAATCFLSL